VATPDSISSNSAVLDLVARPRHNPRGKAHEPSLHRLIAGRDSRAFTGLNDMGTWSATGQRCAVGRGRKPSSVPAAQCQRRQSIAQMSSCVRMNTKQNAVHRDGACQFVSCCFCY
jgi:hypothetical protein